MEEAVIVSIARTAVGKAKRGSLAQTRVEDMGKAVIEEVLRRADGVEKEMVDDVIIGCAMPEGEQGLNMARIVSLYAGLPVSTPAITINRFCSSGLQSIAFAAERIMLGQADVILAGGIESMSSVPMTGHKLSPHPRIVQEKPETYISMGLTAENVARRFRISRQEQDEFALSSHQKATEALQKGKFKAEIVPLDVTQKGVDENGNVWERTKRFDSDEGVRPDTSIEALSKLPPSFAKDGTVTAGNASQMSDGAAMALVMSKSRAGQLGLKPLATFRTFAVTGVEPEIMGIGPVKAIPKVLKQAGLTLDDIDLFEINEAFASQCLQIIHELELDQSKVNVNGGAIALGHPLGCTGTKMTATLIYELQRRGGGRGIVSMCVGGGMGAAGILDVHAS